ncbi:MAG TPA: methylated-DNA--[protein]-cysteine S-methyltransferase [Thermoanaerobaculia bacterium]|jgi:O-6-methylguanine DNA methyltransferase|nr:methylated-DNA--[protein]-cysteine S-methyltransferase [Thermoanaerobaculia bacterium]
MQCRSVLTRVDALRTGELQADERGAVSEHLRTCPTCEASVSDCDDLARSIKSLAAVPPRSCKESIGDSYEQVDDVWVAFSERGIRMIHRGSFEEFHAAYTARCGCTLKAGTLPDALRKQVHSALHGEGVDKPRVDWTDELTELERDVLGTLTRIPRGEVRTYEWVARQVGRPKAVRAVGSVCAKNTIPFVVPCHRVVPSTGGVGQYAFGPALKREMLRREGVDVDALENLGRKGVRFIGSRTTKIVCFPTCRDARRIREENRVPFRAADEALEKGFRPCRRCQPFAIAS